MKNKPIFALAGLILATLPAVSHAACQHTPVRYDYPAQRLDEALQQFAHTSGCPVEVDLGKAASQKVPPLKGVFKPEEALARIVKGKGFKITTTPEGYKLQRAGKKK
jgi:hypothetical protein